MNKHEVKEFFLRNVGIKVSMQEKPTRFDVQVLHQVLDIFNTWYVHIPETNHVIFLNTLLNDLSKLHCCAVSGNPASPCYVGKLAHCEPKGNISIHSYNNCRLPIIKKVVKANHLSYNLGKFL